MPHRPWPMSDVWRATLALWLGGVRFWVPVFMVLMMARGFGEGLILQMTSAFYILTVVLEYPTGVVSDRFSHRLSVGVGLLLLAAGTVGYAIVTTIAGYVVLTVVLALGTTLVSGSDKAIIRMVTTRFGASLATVQVGTAATAAASAVVGGWLALYDLTYPLYATAACNVLGAVLIFSVRHNGTPHMRPQTISQIVAGSIGTIRVQRVVRDVLVVSLFSGAFAFSIKWLYNPLFLETELSPVWWGLATAAATTSIAAGALLYRVRPGADFVALGTLLVLAIGAIGMTWWPAVALGGFLTSHLVRGYLEMRTAAAINAVTDETVIASVFSLDTVTVRIGAAVFTSCAGWVLGAGYDLWVVMGGAALIIALGAGAAFVGLSQCERSCPVA